MSNDSPPIDISTGASSDVTVVLPDEDGQSSGGSSDTNPYELGSSSDAETFYTAQNEGILSDGHIAKFVGDIQSAAAKNNAENQRHARARVYMYQLNQRLTELNERIERLHDQLEQDEQELVDAIEELENAYQDPTKTLEDIEKLEKKVHDCGDKCRLDHEKLDHLEHEKEEVTKEAEETLEAADNDESLKGIFNRVRGNIHDPTATTEIIAAAETTEAIASATTQENTLEDPALTRDLAFLDQIQKIKAALAGQSSIPVAELKEMIPGVSDDVFARIENVLTDEMGVEITTPKWGIGTQQQIADLNTEKVPNIKGHAHELNPNDLAPSIANTFEIVVNPGQNINDIELEVPEPSTAPNNMTMTV